MTVGTTLNIAKHLTDGLATEFSFFFVVFEATHLQVFLRDLEGTVVKTYAQNEISVSGLESNAGTVEIIPAPADNHELIIRRVVPILQGTDIVNQGGFFPEVIEQQLDLIVMQAQQLQEQLNRAIVSAIGDAAYSFGRLNEDDLVQLRNGVLQGLTVAEFIAPAQEAALLAQAFTGPLYTTISAGLAATADGESFAVDKFNGSASVYVNDGGLELFIRLILLDPTSNSAASFIGTSSGQTLQQVLDAIGGVANVNLATNVTGILAIEHGGTGGNTDENARAALGAAKSGVNDDITALKQSATITESGAIAANSIGFRGIPLSTQTQGSLITLALSDIGKLVMNTAGGWSIPANASIPFPLGAALRVYNDSASTQTVAIGGTDTLRWAGTTNTGTRTLAARGYALLTKIKTTEWTIEGNIT